MDVNTVNKEICKRRTCHMKKYPYVVAAACVLVGAIGFASIYATNQSQQRQEELAKSTQQETESQNIDIASNQDAVEEEILIPEFPGNTVADGELEPNVEDEGMVAESEDSPKGDEDNAQEEPQDTSVGNITEEKLHFDLDGAIVWPIEGSVLLDYSTESTIFFPTLQQYQYNPAMVLSGNVNDKVYFIAKGKITNIETNEVTGCTVTQDLGDGYTAIYGQLKELNFEVGDMVECGQVVGYVSEPTKYYSVEGSNVYFQILKDGVPIDPEEVLP